MYHINPPTTVNLTTLSYSTRHYYYHCIARNWKSKMASKQVI